ncbi:hypothetical protein AURDEDRAFT_151906 [Auricularia subglabra TFB-10046 SS5]|nr:hypothetical protein AURDEDRAFT_151906 [Auricularia subglabra TFB-10046 SS5]
MARIVFASLLSALLLSLAAMAKPLPVPVPAPGGTPHWRRDAEMPSCSLVVSSMSAVPEYAASALDQVTIRGYSGVLACFPVALSDDSVDLLRGSLAKVIQSAPFLAGQVVEDDATGWAHVVGPYDVARDFLVVQDERGRLDYGSWRTRRFPVKEIAHLWRLPPLDDLPAPVLLVQLTRMDNGCTLALLFHHSAIDGAGSGRLWAAWAAAARGDTLPELALFPRRETLGTEPIPQGNIACHPGYTTLAPVPAPGPPVESVTTQFWFAEGKLKALKAAATSPDVAAGSWISSHDALAALLWTHIAPTRSMSVIANIRTRLHPPLPASYIGNAVYAASAPGPAGTLQAAALAIRGAVRAVDSPLLEDFLGAVSKERRVYEAHRAPGGPFLVTSWAELGMLGLDWGIDGFHAEYAMFPALLRPGIAIVLPRRPGGLTVALGLPRERIDALLASDEFMRYAEWENGYKP